MAVTIPGELLGRLAPKGSVRSFAPGQRIFVQGEEAADLFIVLEGRVRAYTLMAGGQENTVEVLEAGRVFGDSSFLPGSRRVVTMEAVLASRILCCPAGEVLELCAGCEELTRLLFRHMADTCNYLTDQLVQNSYSTAAQRVAAFLLGESRRRGTHTLPYTQEELAASVALNRVTVARALAGLKKQGLVQGGYGRLVLKDPPGLEALLPPRE